MPARFQHHLGAAPIRGCLAVRPTRKPILVKPPERLTVVTFYYDRESPLTHAVISVDPVRVLCRPGMAMKAWTALGPAPYSDLTCLKCQVLITYGARVFEQHTKVEL